MVTPSELHTSKHTVLLIYFSHSGFANAILAGSISHVSLTSLSTTVRSPCPNGASVAQEMMAFASRSLSGKPTSPSPEIWRQGFGAVVSRPAW